MARIEYDGGTAFRRINKRQARQSFVAGHPVVLCPCKLAPFGGFRPSCMVQRTVQAPEQYTERMADECFDNIVKNFEWYNCNYETGYYPSYWIKQG